MLFLSPVRHALRESKRFASMPAVDSPRTPSNSLPAVNIAEDAFISEPVIDGWVRAGAATRTNSVLTVRDGRRFLLRDAIRVLGRRNGDTDPYGFTGKVEPIREFIRRGASVSADGLRLGPAVYDVEYGFVTIAG
jgi:hypothetical protein